MRVSSFAGSMLLLCMGGADGFSSYVSHLPNGDKVVVNGQTIAALGHVAAAGGGSRNAFGSSFESADEVWTTAFCQADSDGDGASNGLELGDPDCTWTVGSTPKRTTDLSHPGLASSVTTASASDADSTTDSTADSTADSSTDSTADSTSDGDDGDDDGDGDNDGDDDGDDQGNGAANAAEKVCQGAHIMAAAMLSVAALVAA